MPPFYWPCLGSVCQEIIDRKGCPEYFDSFGHPPPREIKDFCVLMQKAGITMMYLFKNFILQHVDNLLCFIFIKDVLV